MSEQSEHNRKIAIKVFSDRLGASQEFSEEVYSQLLKRFAKPCFHIGLNKKDVETIMLDDSWFVPSPVDLNEYEVFKALGARQGLMSAKVSARMPQTGDLVAQLRDLEGKAFVICGDFNRATDASREDFVEHPKEIIFEPKDASAALAAATMMGLGKECSGMSPDEIAEASFEKGECETMIAAPISRKNIRMIGASTDEAETWTKGLMRQAGVLCPVVMFTQDPNKRNVEIKGDKGEKTTSHAKLSYFEIGDNVCRKPVAAESVTGKIVGVMPSEIVVDWPGERERLSLVEALSSICHVPLVLGSEDGGLQVYAMPGLSEEASEVINASGHDCAAIYSILTNSGPIAQSEIGWENRVVGSLRRAGIEARPVKGLVYANEGDEAFIKKSWIECDLPEGRLVIDLEPSKISVTSPDEDYLSFDEASRPELG